MKKHWKLYLWVLLISTLCFSRYIFLNHGHLMMYGDLYEINYKLWLGGWNAVHQGTLGEFCWSLGLGANTFSYVFYFLTSPFFWLSCLFPREFIPYSFLVFQIVNMTIGFIVTDLWLSKVTKSELGSIVGSFIITFSAYVFFYIQAPQLEYLFICYPLVLFFTECFLQDHKWKGVVLTLGITGIWNYYLLYMLVPFLIVYTVIRYLVLNQDWNMKELCKEAGKYFLLALLGIGLSAVILVPCGYLILSMPRFSSGSNTTQVILNIKQLYRIFTSLFFPPFAKLDANPLIEASSVTQYGWSGGCSLYALILSCILVPLMAKLRTREKKFYLSFAGILLIFLLFPIFSYVFQMSVDTRFYYMYVLFFGMISSIVFEAIENKEIQIKSIQRAALITSICIIVSVAIAFIFKLNTTRLLILALLTSIVMIAFLYCYQRALQKINAKKIILLLSIEALFAGTMFGYRNEPIVYWALEEPSLHTNVSETLDQLEDEGSFYRVMYDSKTIVVKEHDDRDDDTFQEMSSNEPFANNYKGFGFYESVYNTNQEEFIVRMKSTWNMWQMVGRTRTHNMLSSKYWYTYDYSDPIPYGYEKVETEDTPFDLYQNKNYVELGYTYDKTINSQYLLSLPYLEQDRIMDEYLAVETSTNTSYDTNDAITQIALLPDDDVRVYDFEEPVSNVILYIENFGLPHLTIRTYYEGNEVNTYDIWEFNYVDLPIYEPIDQIVIDAPALYGGKTTVPLYIEQMDGLIDEQFEEYTQEHFENVNAQNDYIEADITVYDHTKHVFTSIPYDQGWSVTVDGQKIDYEKVQLGFIGFQLEPGEHHITFTYHIPGLRLGLTITGLSLGIFILLIIIEKKRSSAK